MGDQQIFTAAGTLKQADKPLPTALTPFVLGGGGSSLAAGAAKSAAGAMRLGVAQDKIQPVITRVPNKSRGVFFIGYSFYSEGSQIQMLPGKTESPSYLPFRE